MLICLCTMHTWQPCHVFWRLGARLRQCLRLERYLRHRAYSTPRCRSSRPCAVSIANGWHRIVVLLQGPWWLSLVTPCFMCRPLPNKSYGVTNNLGGTSTTFEEGDSRVMWLWGQGWDSVKIWDLMYRICRRFGELWCQDRSSIIAIPSGTFG